MDQLYNLFFLYMDSPRRRQILDGTTDLKGDNYLLYGLDEYLKAGYTVRHNLETAKRSSLFVHLLSRLINRGLRVYGGIGGDFRSVIACLQEMNRSDIILSTVDPVGIPLALFKANNLIRRPAIYTSVGFPERMHRFRNEKVANTYCKIFSKMDAVVGYGYEECRLLKAWLQPEGADDSVHFVPFGVDVNYFTAAEKTGVSEVDILSIGADPKRDFSLLLALARSCPSFQIEIITNKEHAGQLPDLPENIKIVCDIPIEQMKKRMEATAVVVLPIKENSYSGATTTLLQAMAMEKPVVVSRVGAIRDGYYLKDGYNCLLIEPGNEEELIRKTDLLVNDVQLQKTLAGNACKTVRQNLTWEHYINNMRMVLNHCYQEHLRKEQ